MHRADIGAVAALHDHLFPVKYDARFYFDLLLSDRITLLAFLEFDPLLQQVDHTSDGVAAAAAECPAILREPLLIGVATGRCREQSGTCRRHMSGYVTTLGVDKRFRRIGLGKFLLKVSAAAAAGVKAARVKRGRCFCAGLGLLRLIAPVLLLHSPMCLIFFSFRCADFLLLLLLLPLCSTSFD
jgi:ribosomal protein S18 acetylase RimI-like enzyme